MAFCQMAYQLENHSASGWSGDFTKQNTYIAYTAMRVPIQLTQPFGQLNHLADHPND